MYELERYRKHHQKQERRNAGQSHGPPGSFVNQGADCFEHIDSSFRQFTWSAAEFDNRLLVRCQNKWRIITAQASKADLQK